MKFHRREGSIDYSTYRFSYTEWAELEPEEEPDPAYAGGYLPYSGDPEDPRHLFYMARSLRVNMNSYSIGKSRRYDHREWTGFGLGREQMEKEAFLERYGEAAMEQARKWMAPRFGEKALSMKRLAYILGKPYLKDVLVWQEKERMCAFALLAKGNWGAHYWYVFYENGTGNQAAPGHGYLVDFLDWTRNEGLPYAYIGTTYGLKSRYKSRGIKGIQFWDGDGWNPDREELKRRQQADDHKPCRIS